MDGIRRALRIACEFIGKTRGDCPLSYTAAWCDDVWQHPGPGGCEKNCVGQTVDCWVMYFLDKARDEEEE